MKYRLSTKYKTGIIEADSLGIIVNSSRCFREDIGLTITGVSEKYYDKKYNIRLDEYKETSC